ncbi:MULTISPECIES: hypothetical protein [unclassified Gilliamella]|uniref:hypothetical protein n=1 Tax=unclassified Gilliamella TaxID=2685620 RepID=UPI002269DE22|nr:MULTISPECIES: hypothetical protein [unclassified Gilliamella]MCX8587280.1 hypothetical protein [Gilliamella sp. B3801]MCX8591965.1 hypothetical protein [Gilliamella sp. B3804]
MKISQITPVDTSENVVIHLNQFAKIEQAETIARACINAHSTPADFVVVICCIADLLHAVIEKSE